MLMRLGRVAAPIILARLFGADVVAGAKAAPGGTQQDHARRQVIVGAEEGVKQLMLQFGANRVELVGAI